MKTKFRLNHRCFGSYQFGKKQITSAEIEEVVIGLESLSFEDYLECRSFDFTVSIFYSDDILHELLSFLKTFNIKSSELILAIHNKKQFYTKKIVNLYKSFNDATISELWDSKQQIKEYITDLLTQNEMPETIGCNILFKHRAIAFMEMIDDIIEIAFQVANELLDQSLKNRYSKYLLELKMFNKLRKKNIFDFQKKYNFSFNFDFCEAIETGFKNIPKKLNKPLDITFYHTDEQKSYYKGFAPGLNGAMRIIPRLPLRDLFRTIKYGE